MVQIEKFLLGQPMVLDLTTKNLAGALTDPTTLTLTIEQPSGALLGPSGAYAWPPDGSIIVKSSAGTFTATITPTLQGLHSYRWIATGTAAGVFEGVFEVVSVQVDVLSILKLPEDFEAIRNVLGVTTLDLEDSTIKSLAYAPWAEIQAKQRVTTWATDLVDATKGPQLRLAVVYLAGALVAETYAKGGMIGFVPSTVSNLPPRDWKQTAAELRAAYEAVIEFLTLGSTVPVEFDLVGQKVNGPSRTYYKPKVGSDWWKYPPVHGTTGLPPNPPDS